MSRVRQRLSKASRITRRVEFGAAFRQGRRFSDNLFQVRAAPNQLDHARLGISVPARVAPRAVARNRIKRQVREVFRRRRHEFGGLDLVVLAQAAADRADNATLRASLQQHLTRIAQLCKKS